MKRLKVMLRMAEGDLFNAMSVALGRRYKQVITKEDYLIAVGDIPYVLIAHVDTVFYNRHDKEIYYDQEQNVMWSPQGAGFDDRAGVYAIWEIVLKHGFKPTVILTRGEEMGCVGASELAKDYKRCPVEANCLIELDRANKNDCVFYYCDNKQFKEFIEGFGFITQEGSFTDISALMEPWGLAGVNLSIGYQYEHSTSELLHIDWMEDTIAKVETILQTKSSKFKFRGVKV